ncbi:hypothetical protein [Nocardia sp. NPDC051463]|uniref:hypothetical protein n=1 Tax=Nocardia sp. NPDC051463 TaxID=3154845 RepID=UPI0034246DF6
MPEILMPDQTAPGYPDAFKFSPAVENYYRGLPRTLRRNWDNYGSDAAVVPNASTVRRITGTARAHIKSYENLTERLDQRFRELQEMDERLAVQINNSLLATRKGRQQIEAAIQRVNTEAGTVPVGMSKSVHILRYLSNGLDHIDQIVQDTTKSQRSHASVVIGLSTQLIESTQQAASVTTPAEQSPGIRSATGDGSGRIPARTPTSIDDREADDHRAVPAAHSLVIPRTGTPAGDATLESPELNARSSNAHDAFRIGATEQAHQSPTTHTGTPPVHAVRGGGESIAALPEPAAQQHKRTPWTSRTDTAGGSRSSNPHQPDQAAIGAGVGPGPRNPAYSAAAARVGVRNKSRKRSRRAPVMYLFPDGRTQEVAPATAAVLDAAFGNRLETNARLAVSDTGTTASTERHPTPTRRPSRSAVTGDTAVWSRRSAVLVVFGAGTTRTREVIIDGRLRPFSARMRDEHGEFGAFDGFYCPSHAEPEADNSGTTHDATGPGRKSRHKPAQDSPADVTANSVAPRAGNRGHRTSPADTLSTPAGIRADGN